MLSTLFNTIQTTLGLSKNFILSYLFPLLLFLAGSGAVMGAIGRFDWRTDLPKEGWVYIAIIVLIAGAAYVFAAAGTLLRELLEGRHILELPYFRRQPHRRQRAQLDRLTDEYWAYYRRLVQLCEDVTRWKNGLKRAARVGYNLPWCTYNPDETSPGYRAFQDAARCRMEGDPVPKEVLESAVDYLRPLLQRNSLRVGEAGKRLERDYGLLRAILEYAQDRDAYERNRRFQTRQFFFPGIFEREGAGETAAPANILAPTVMGNIARNIRSYALNRYSFDMDVLWSRLQAVIQKKDVFQSIQDAKTQLEFLVSLCWLTGIFWVGWAIAVPLTYNHNYYWTARGVFTLLLLAGPPLTYMWYKLACQSYTAFADLMRTSVDLYRLELFDALAIPRPTGIAEENETWNVVVQWIAFDEVKPGFIYKRDAK